MRHWLNNQLFVWRVLLWPAIKARLRMTSTHVVLGLLLLSFCAGRVSAAEPFVVCPGSGIDWSVDILQRVVLHEQIPADVQSDKTHYSVWPCKNKTAQAQSYTMGELLDFSLSGVKDEAAANAYAAVSVGWLTQRENDFLQAKAAELAAKLWPGSVAVPPLPPPPLFQVAPIAGGHRPVVRLTASGTSNVTVGGVAQRIAVGKPCGAWSGRTAYYSVTGEQSTTGVVLPAGAVASCVGIE